MAPVKFQKVLKFIKKNNGDPTIEKELGVNYHNHIFNSKNRKYSLKDFDDLFYGQFKKFIYNGKNDNKFIRNLLVDGEKKYDVDNIDSKDNYLLVNNIEMNAGVTGAYVNYNFKDISNSNPQDNFICAYDFFSELAVLFPEYDIYSVRDYDHIKEYNFDEKGDVYKMTPSQHYSLILIKREFKTINDSIFLLESIIKRQTFVEGDDSYDIICLDGFTIIEFDTHKNDLFLDVCKKINENFVFYSDVCDEVASFEMVMKRGNDYFTKNIKLKDFNPIFKLSTHYNGGESFLKWHESFVYTSKKKKKGISIFHGPAGTGKTSYIKKLSYDLKNTHRFFLMPAQMIFELHAPGLFQNFIMENIVPIIEDGWKVVLVLEDAEEILKSRDKHNNPYISTILNLSDGIMGEIYNFQIICTMNSSIKDIDSALLRPNRLITCKNFDYLNEEEGIVLYKDISGKEINKIDCSIIIDEDNIKNESYEKDVKRMQDGKYTVGEIYKLVESLDPNILNGYIDGNNKEKSSVGFKMK